VALPAYAQVQAAITYIRNARAAEDFLVLQDASSAPARYAALLKELKKGREHLVWNPTSGRPARFLQLRSAQGQAVGARALALAQAHGVPSLRELVVKPYVVLYAHSDVRVVLLAMKHERELTYSLGR
jgi:hypothetical protein